jgi:hypothetical protein
VIAVDFFGWRPQAEFATLFEGAWLENEVVQLLPFGLAGEALPPLSAAGYATAYAEELAGAVTAVAAVVGFCSGGPIAHELGCRLAAAGVEVGALVLIEALPQPVEEVVAAFEDIADRSGASDGAGAGEAAARARAALAGGRVEEGASILFEGLDGVVGRALAAMGADPAGPVRDELVSRYRAWLAYLLAASRFEATPFPGRAYLVYSEACDPPASWPASETTFRRVGRPFAELLSSDEVRSTVALATSKRRT